MPPQLDTLPPEILFSILSFTEPVSNLKLKSYALNALAETNKQLNSVVEEYARGLLKQNGRTTPQKSSKIATCRRKWLGEICRLCLRVSKRRATLYPALTCCRLCDKKHFPKMTMSDVIKSRELSKLDLFTPNALHPRLPPLAHGAYSVMGDHATMIAEDDIYDRAAYIHERLGKSASNSTDMHKRPATHNRIIKHLGIKWNSKTSSWQKAYEESEDFLEKGPKSMKTVESRREYVRKALKKEWADLGYRGSELEMLDNELQDGRRIGNGVIW